MAGDQSLLSHREALMVDERTARAVDREHEHARAAGLRVSRATILRNLLARGIADAERGRAARGGLRPGLALSWAGAPR